MDNIGSILISIICALIIMLIVPADVFMLLLTLGTLFVVGSVGWFAFILFISEV